MLQSSGEERLIVTHKNIHNKILGSVLSRATPASPRTLKNTQTNEGSGKFIQNKGQIDNNIPQ